MPGVVQLIKEEVQGSTPDSRCWDGEDISVRLPRGFELDCGIRLEAAVFQIRISGPKGAPLFVVSGGISGNRFVCDAPTEAGWWSEMVGPGKGIDIRKSRVLGFEFLPGGDAAAAAITSHDQARALAFAIGELGEGKLQGFVGSSYGGMIGLAFASEYPELLDKLCVISAAHRAHPMATAIRGIQRRILKLAQSQGCPEEGVALARQLAMTTYRTADEFQARFASVPKGDGAGDPYDVCEYLIARGEAFANRMPIERLLLLSDSMDRHRVDPGQITTPTLLVSVAGDRLVPPSDMRALATTLAGPAKIVELESTFGHDAFLLEPDFLNALLSEFCEGETP